MEHGESASGPGDNIEDRDQSVTGVDGNFLFWRRNNREVVATMTTDRFAPEYNMEHEFRGLALIFAHELFDEQSWKPRPETNVDCANLERELKKLDFDVRIYKDFRYEAIVKTIQETAAENHSNRDCILVALITRGENDFVCSRDQFYKSESIWKAFTADKCPTLASKPKLFLIEASRGTRRDSGTYMTAAQSTETDGYSNSSYKIPCFADFLVVFCTIPEHCSWSDSLHGSWFIQSLCAELNANGRQLDLLMLLTFVTQRVAVHYESIDEGQKQVVSTISTLTRILRFNDYKRKD